VSDFQLFETMLVTRDGEVRHVDRHLARLQQSARALGFVFDVAKIQSALDAGVARATADIASRLRLTLFHDGHIDITHAPLKPLPDGRVDLLIEEKPLSEPRPLSAHKTTMRDEYDQGTRRAEVRGAFDSLFFTHDGRLVEGGRCNIFVQIDSRWWTPPLSDGALPGIMRTLLLEDPAWGAGERSLLLADLHRGRSLMVCNALRGAVPGRIVIDP
jgi:para-aminobenzoate synthetase / 4-amino-4-deoxychorismate lyase